MLYDTLLIYGNVELHANFAPEEYAIAYYLNGGANAVANPDKYTVKSGMIVLESPQKAGDTFVGWTGSNGEEPQKDVVIPVSSTGELEFYANYLKSGREDDVEVAETGEDKIWSFGNELYIRTSRLGSVVRIYSPEGVLQKIQVLVTAGESKIKLATGMYVVTLNNGIAKIVWIK